MKYLPLFLNVQGRKCVIVGGGEVAMRKATLLHRAGASLWVVAPIITPRLQKLLEDGGHHSRLGSFMASDLKDAVLVIGASDDETLNAQVSSLAHEQNILVNVVDQPELCSVIFPAIVDRSPIVVAISTGGASPVLARRIKEQIEILLPGSLPQLASLLAMMRDQVKRRIANFSQRMRFWEQVLNSDVSELAINGQLDQAKASLERQLDSVGGPNPTGEVYLVGAGPGDPDLLTLRALRLMHKADVVLYDRLVTDEILKRVRPDAEKIHVGKERAHHPVPQERINEMLIRLAKDGKRVLRLKGGDPFIFGRGGEEIESLLASRIPFQVIPGITAASGCASYSGIPLTHRDHSQSVVFLTGHAVEGEDAPDWESLLTPRQTLVFYMGLQNLDAICSKLIHHGMERTMPAALIQQGTTSRQKVLTGTLEDLPHRVASSQIQAPTLLIVGEVVRLRDKLSWYHPQEARS
jgi:uroporphyrin-III C-methyltransferase/precorrin-2 dehydrogenase/sirohydrochlorin ferrochelatase